MLKLMLISTLCTLAGYAAVHFIFFSKPAPVAQAPAPQVSAEPVVLANVVEVTDTEPLLDPLPGQPVGLPFDAPIPPELSTPTKTAPSPPSREDADEQAPEEIGRAPHPRGLASRSALDSTRTAWYGPDLFPRQMFLPPLRSHGKLPGIEFSF